MNDLEKKQYHLKAKKRDILLGKLHRAILVALSTTDLNILNVKVSSMLVTEDGYYPFVFECSQIVETQPVNNPEETK